uniref:Interleukin-1 n=1 Tax=Apteryx owenii TaxID=8824 RepID=A0A8B9PHD1_APTOW
MAFVPDLDMLESSSLNEETFYGLDCPCLQKKPRLSSDLQPSGQSPAEVGVQVTLAEGHPVKTFRQAAILVVAVTKLLKRPSHHDFADSDLGSFLDAVFGRVCGVGEVTGGRCVLGGGVLSPLGTLAPLLTVCRPAEPVAFQRFDSSYAGAPVYRYIRSQSFDIHDIDHKCFTLESPTQLVALHLQGPSANRKVKLNIALYRPKSSKGSAGAMQTPVALGIKGYKLYMSCVMNGAEPTLQLEEADISRDIDSFELTRFIFYRLDSLAEHTTRFESAAFPGWFICTSPQPRQPVGITNQPGEVNITTYYLSSR